MIQQAVLVLDCGATNVRAAVVSPSGHILSQASRVNQTFADPFYTDGRIWDTRLILNQLCECSREAVLKLNQTEIVGLTITTFGVDGTFVDDNNQLLYPVISWQCLRTVPVMENIGKVIDRNRLYQITGLKAYHFNTINKLVWFKENRPDVIERASRFLFFPSLLIMMLTGENVTDTTMAGTSMLTDLHSRSFSETILSQAGISGSLFPRMVEPGTIAGYTTPSATRELGLPAPVPVVVSGHDTQFAVFGAGADDHTPVLSSGTWEILMARTTSVDTSDITNRDQVTTEFDARPGYFNPGVMWTAGGMLEWLTGLLYPEMTGRADKYDRIIAEAAAVSPGCDNVKMTDTDVFSGNGVFGRLSQFTSRGHLYRAAIEALSLKAYQGLKQLEKAGSFSARSLICVGGGAKNSLWNQVRADMLGLPVVTLSITETTVIGASLFAFAAAGKFSSPEEALSHLDMETKTVAPGADHRRYQDIISEIQ